MRCGGILSDSIITHFRVILTVKVYKTKCASFLTTLQVSIKYQKCANPKFSYLEKWVSNTWFSANVKRAVCNDEIQFSNFVGLDWIGCKNEVPLKIFC